MQTLTWQNRLYARLLQDTQQGALKRHCAYMAAGWLSFVGVRPKFQRQAAAGIGALAGGVVLLVVALLLIGPVLNQLQPALRAAGTAPGGTWPVLAVLALLTWRYVAGRRLLNSLGALNGNIPFSVSAR